MRFFSAFKMTYYYFSGRTALAVPFVLLKHLGTSGILYVQRGDIMEKQSAVKSAFSFIFKLIRIFVGGPWMVLFALTAVYMVYQLVMQYIAFASYGVFPLRYVMVQTGTAIAAAVFSLLFAKMVFYKKLAKLPWGKTLLALVVVLLASGTFGAIDEIQKDSFTTAYYPPYILNWPSQSVNGEIACDYTQDTVYLYGDFAVTTNSFRQNNCIEFVTVPSLTDSLRVEIVYKGEEAELHLNEYDYRMDEYGEYTIGAYIWPLDYDYYNTRPEDVAYMYKHKVNLSYSELIVVEKIIVYTAYPEKIDTSEVWFQK